MSSSDILAEYKKLAATPGTPARKEGDAESALKNAARTLEASYEFPYLAHAALEPMNCVVKLDSQGCEIWNGEQFQTADQAAVAQLLGLKPEQVKLNQLYAGGSFGRRANRSRTSSARSAAIAEGDRWQGPGQARLGPRGRHARWLVPADVLPHTLQAGRCPGQPRRLEAHHRRAVDPRHRIREHDGQGRRRHLGRRRSNLFLRDREPRGVAALAQDGRAGAVVALGRLDAYRVRHRMLPRRDRARDEEGSVRAAPRAPRQASAPQGGARSRGARRLGQAAARGRARGIAVHESFNTYVAQVVEISAKKIERVVCAVDCGVAVNPNIIAMQMESGIGYGLLRRADRQSR